MALKISKDALKSGIKGAVNEATQGFVSIPNNKYVFRLESIIYGVNKKGRDMITEVWRVLLGEYKGKDYKVFTNLENDDGLNTVGIKMLLSRWRAMGYDISEIEDDVSLKKACKAVESDHPTIEGSIYDNPKNPQFKNFRIDSIVEAAGSTSEESEAEPAEEEAPKPKKRGPKPKAGEPEIDPEPVPEPEPAVAEEEEEEAQLTVGSKVQFDLKGADTEGVVKEIKDENAITVHYQKDGKTFKATIKMSDISGIISE